MKGMAADTFFDPEALAEHLGVPLRTIYAWRHKRYLPAGYRLGKHVRWKRSEIESWLEEQRDPARPAA